MAVTDHPSAPMPTPDEWRTGVDNIIAAVHDMHPAGALGYLASFISRHGLADELVEQIAETPDQPLVTLAGHVRQEDTASGRPHQ